jgi:O-antigen ligase
MNRLNRRNKFGNTSEKLFFIFFSLIVLVNPFPLGSNRVWAWSIEAIFASSLLMLMIACSLFSKDCVSWHRLKRMKWEALLMGLWLLLSIIYLIPLPLSLLQIISPTVAGVYASTGMDYGYLSLDVYASYKILLLSVYYIVVFILAVLLINSRTRIKIILLLFLFLGVIEAIYGMYLVSIEQTGTFVQVTTVSVKNASGTFINKNHFVAFLSMCFMLGLAIRQTLSHKNNFDLQRSLGVRFIRFIGHPIRLLDFCLFLMLMGIWNTHSRAGLVAFLLAMVFLVIINVIIKKHKNINIKTLMIGFILVILGLVLVADDINYLFNTLGLHTNDSLNFIANSAQDRLLAFNQAIENYHKYWFTGVGPGAYQVFFVNHRILDQTAYFDHAHNDYIEFIIEYGLFSVILLMLLILILFRIVKFIYKTHSHFYKIIGISVISCLLYLLIHGNIDFNARIPANVVTIIVAISVIYGKIIMLDVNRLK